MNDLCKVLWKLAQYSVVLEKGFLNVVNVFSLFQNFLSDPSNEQTWIHFTQGYCMLSFEIGLLALEKKMCEMKDGRREELKRYRNILSFI